MANLTKRFIENWRTQRTSSVWLFFVIFFANRRNNSSNIQKRNLVDVFSLLPPHHLLFYCEYFSRKIVVLYFMDLCLITNCNSSHFYFETICYIFFALSPAFPRFMLIISPFDQTFHIRNSVFIRFYYIFVFEMVNGGVSISHFFSSTTRENFHKIYILFGKNIVMYSLRYTSSDGVFYFLC